MKTQKSHLFIPRKKSETLCCRIEGLEKIEDVPIEDTLVKILARVYYGRRAHQNERT